MYVSERVRDREREQLASRCVVVHVMQKWTRPQPASSLQPQTSFFIQDLHAGSVPDIHSRPPPPPLFMFLLSLFPHLHPPPLLLTTDHTMKWCSDLTCLILPHSGHICFPAIYIKSTLWYGCKVSSWQRSDTPKEQMGT